MRIVLEGRISGRKILHRFVYTERVQTVYGWMYLFCVVDGQKGRLLCSWLDSMKSACTAQSVKGLKRGTGGGGTADGRAAAVQF